jgi:hypothetical protein
MTKPAFILLAVLSSAVFIGRPIYAQVSSTPPVTLEEKQALYDATIEDRTQNILKVLALNDAAKSNRVHSAIVAHYHALKNRDEAIDAELWDMSAGSTEWEAERMRMIPGMSQPLHEKFIAQLAADLTPDQIEQVKDKLTYGKVEFTYNAYCSILPQMTDAEKTQVLAILKQAGDEAIDGGSAGEKSAIFQKYKTQINGYLTTQGYDVAKSIQDWNAKQAMAKNQTSGSVSNAVPVAK